MSYFGVVQFAIQGTMMGWLPHNAGTWGVILGVVAIILTVPLGIASNLIAPKLQNWWAARSLASLRERITEVEKEFRPIEEARPFTQFEIVALQSINRVGWVVVWAVHTLVGVVVIAYAAWTMRTGEKAPEKIIWVFVIFVGLEMALQAWTIFHNNIAMKLRNEEGKEIIRREIAKLKEKLAEKENATKALQ